MSEAPENQEKQELTANQWILVGICIGLAQWSILQLILGFIVCVKFRGKGTFRTVGFGLGLTIGLSSSVFWAFYFLGMFLLLTKVFPRFDQE